MAKGAHETRQLTHPGGIGASLESHSLVLYHRDGAQVARLLPGRPIIVGRTAPADVVVPDGSLSRQHARFTRSEEGVRVEDLGSTNGTWLGGESVTEAALRPGEAIVLGAVTAVIQAVGPGAQLGLDGHDRFLTLLENEVERARHFGRSFSIAMFAAKGRVAVHDWAQHVSRALRPVDHLALYSSSAVELLLPELDDPRASELARSIVDDGSALVCGLASYPHCGTTAEMLLESCRTALLGTGPETPIVQAPSIVVSERTIAATETPAGLIVESPAMQEVVDMARRVARGTIPVFLHGETGTGKEVLARFIHQSGPRKEAPLVAVNCAAIPSQLVESTLFGHVKGAFTGANAAHAGVFEAASGGTVLLDEIGELPAAAQAALLRVLEIKAVTRVGSTKEAPVDVRIIAATHRDLEAMCASGEFREDLYYRLNAVTLEIPPLRERREDIGPLTDHFLALAAEANDSPIHDIAPEARRAMLAYNWSGNIRELRNAIDRAIVIAEHDIITNRDLPRKLRDAAGSKPEREDDASEAAAPVVSTKLRTEDESFRHCMERLETMVLIEALAEAKGNQTEAARRLDMPRRTLVHKIKTLGLKRGDYGAGQSAPRPMKQGK